MVKVEDHQFVVLYAKNSWDRLSETLHGYEKSKKKLGLVNSARRHYVGQNVQKLPGVVQGPQRERNLNEEVRNKVDILLVQLADKKS